MSPSFMKAAAWLAASTTLWQGAFAAPSASALPIVDLGYERQQATLFNSTGNFYNFSNIRYAAPPVGDLRFRAPQAPQRNRGQVQTGSPDRICAQADPAWLLIAEQYGASERLTAGVC